jgi:hypothetical protein
MGSEVIQITPRLSARLPQGHESVSFTGIVE